MTFSLRTNAFSAGGGIPKKYTYEGENLSPPLTWSGAPAGVKSFALICSDPDAPHGVFQHWAIYDIPGQRTGLEEGFKPTPPIKLGLNDFGSIPGYSNVGYGGPLPPRGHGPHRYYFRLYALSTAALPVKEPATCLEIAKAAEPFTLATAEVMGTYER